MEFIPCRWGCWLIWFQKCSPMGSSWGTSVMSPALLPPEGHFAMTPEHWNLLLINVNKTDLWLVYTMTNWQSWKICENSLHMVSFKCLALVWVICPLEKSNTSSLNNFRIAMLFWQRLSLVLLAPTMSGMKDCQFFGHSLFKTYE